MALSNKDIKISYFSSKAQTPFIVKPKTDKDWQRDRLVRFEWLYSGSDIQQEYTIQIFVKNFFEITDEEKNYWNETDSSENNINIIENKYIFEFTNKTKNTFVNLDLNNLLLKNGLNLFLPDGVYRWRVKVRGVISKEYSDWANDGFVRIDSEGPIILNASAFSPGGDLENLGQKTKLSCSISDMSSPYYISRRLSDSGFDRNVDREGYPSFNITYDYRDHSVVLRAQSGNDKNIPKQRYYGLISFHKPIEDKIEPEPDFFVQDVIKAAYLYTINKKDGSMSQETDDGPFQETLINDENDFSLEKILDINGFDDNVSKRFRPRGFPSFIQGDIFSVTSVLSNKPATFEKPHEKSFFSPFPIHSRFVSGVRKLNYNNVSSSLYGNSEQIFESFVEFRYGPPLETVFIYMNRELTQLLAYGQYSIDSLNKLTLNPDTTETLEVVRGLSLSVLKSYDETISKMDKDARKYEIFDSNNNFFDTRKGVFYYSDINSNKYPLSPRSNYFFFNLVPTKNDDRDVALKIYLNKDIYTSAYESNPVNQILDSFEIHMFPDTDCSLAYKNQSLNYNPLISGENTIGTYKQPIPINQVGIGRARISIKDLPFFTIPLDGEENFDINDQKRFYKHIKYASSNNVLNGSSNLILTPQEWGSKDPYFLDNSRIGSSVKFNGSFRIKIPEYRWASYYHPTSVYYAENGDLPALPHILDADPNKGSIDNIINWDSIEFKTSSFDFYDKNNLMKFEFFYPSDFAKFEGNSQFYGQSNPHFYNHLRIQSSDYTFGTNLRIRGSSLSFGENSFDRNIKKYGWMTGFEGYGDLGFTLYEKGWSHDGTWYNFIDKGYFGLSDIEPIFEYIEGSLQVFLNGQILVGQESIVINDEGNSPIPSYRENIKNLHEFEFINLSNGGLFSPPNENDVISVSFRTKEYNEDFEFFGPFHLNGDGVSFQFSTPDLFVPGTLRVYLNGLLLTENIDYIELKNSDGFKFIPNINFNGKPEIEDEIAFFYKKKDFISTKNSKGPYFTSCKNNSNEYSLSDDFERPLNETFEPLSLMLYLNGSLLERGVDYYENIDNNGFELVPIVTSKDVIGVVYDTVYNALEVKKEILVGPFFIKPNSSNRRYSIRGFWSANSKIKTRIRFRDFSNHLFRKSVKVSIDKDIESNQYFTKDIYPKSIILEDKNYFIFNNGENSVLNDYVGENSPSWILFNQDLPENDLKIFTSNLVGSDFSAQGIFPLFGEGTNDPSWTSSNRNIFAGYFLITEDDEGEKHNQIIRSIHDKPSFGESIIVFGPLKNNKKILETEESLISGDLFSMGNIFGKIYPSNTSQFKKVNLYIDINENISGINGIKTFVTDLQVSQKNEDQKSKYYFGSKDINGKVKPLPIFMQKINNFIVDFSSPSSISQSVNLLKNSRTSVSFIKWFFENRITSWKKIDGESIDKKDLIDAGLGLGRIKHEIEVSGEGYKLIYIQVKDKGENASNIYCIPIYIQESDEIEIGQIENVTLSVDDQIISEKTILNEDGENYFFEKNINVRDADEFRTIKVERPLEKYSVQVVDPKTNISSIKESFRDHRKIDTVLMGLSDNYGLSYNVYSPYTSVKSWRFDRPISIPIKNLTGNRGPEWYFDPNDIRHYPVDSLIDYEVGKGSLPNQNIVLNNVENRFLPFHVPMNGTISPITIIGLRNDDINGDLGSTFGRANPIAEKIWQNRDELIGKKIKIGSLPSDSFDILHIFRTNFISDAKIFTSTGAQNENSFRRIDGDISGIRKVWIVISDPNALCALVLSRKFQYVNNLNSSVNLERYRSIRYFTGTAKRLGLNWFVSQRSISGQSGNKSADFFETLDFGYYKEEEDIPEDINSIVNNALNMSGNISDGFDPTSSIEAEKAENFIYILPASTIEKNSSLKTGEGWTAQVFHAYNPDSGNFQDNEGILNSIDKYHNQLLGIKIYDKMIFGKDIDVTLNIEKTGIGNFDLPDGNNEQMPFVFISGGILDNTISNVSFSVINQHEEEIHSGIIESVNTKSSNQTIKDGRVLIIDRPLPDVDYSSNNFKIKIKIKSLDSFDVTTGTEYNQGWFPDIDGLFVPYIGQPLGTVNSTNQEDVHSRTKYAVIIRGSFYIQEEGEYRFVVEKNAGAYADLFIDYLDQSVLVTDVFEDYTKIDDVSEVPTSTKIVGGRILALSSDSTVSELTKNFRTFYLRKGWHIAKIRYVSALDPVRKPKNILNIKYSKPNWGEYEFPIIGSNSNDFNFMAKSYRTVYARFLDDKNRTYPVFFGFGKEDLNITKSSRFSRAIIGFYESLSGTIANRIKNQIVNVERVPGENYGEIKIRSRSGLENMMTFGGHLIEEASGIYESSIIDGGSDFRFWRNISWNLKEPLPEGTSVEFYIRTAESETELLNKTYNNIEDEINPKIIPPITVSGQDILKFSQQSINISDNPKIFRFLQFKMILKSRIRGNTPIVDDVSISYSKINSVNFFTTTFDLKSNIIRAILSYNGNIPLDPNGVALSDIQFGICTKEIVDGVVSTNFDDYAIIPINEAFSLRDLGINASPNNKFRIGIKFISTENAIPTVNDFALLWSTDGEVNRTKDFLKN